MSETIRLIGGPADGRSLEWDGGDVLYVISNADDPEPPSLTRIGRTRSGDPVSYFREPYRRSMRSRQLFVH